MEEIIERTQKIQDKIKDGWNFTRGLLPDYQRKNNGNFIPVLNADNPRKGIRATIHSQEEFDEFLSE